MARCRQYRRSVSHRRLLDRRVGAAVHRGKRIIIRRAVATVINQAPSTITTRRMLIELGAGRRAEGQGRGIPSVEIPTFRERRWCCGAATDSSRRRKSWRTTTSSPCCGDSTLWTSSKSSRTPSQAPKRPVSSHSSGEQASSSVDQPRLSGATSNPSLNCTKCIHRIRLFIL